MADTHPGLSIAPDRGPADWSIPREPDEMGFGHDGGDGVIWLPRSQYPKRSDALKWWTRWAGIEWVEASVRARWAVYDHEYAAQIGEDWWRECDKGTPGAFRVWRCE